MRDTAGSRERPDVIRGLRSLVAATLLAVASGAVDTAVAQDGAVRGTVTHERTRRPIVGAQVVAVGTDRGAITDASGRFAVTGLSGPQVTLRVSMLGYRAVERQVGVGATGVDITLAETAVELDEIIVTGVAGGTQRRAIGNAVSQIRAAEVVETAPVPNIQSLLNARAPGVIVTPGTGMVGSGSRIRIRGASSFSLSNEPLIVVDGVRVDNATGTGPAVQAFGSSVISRLNDFNPRDIESIEVIKGPAAATLYGTEASNGVIQIITKKGAVGAPRLNMTVRQGANWFANAEGRVPVNYWRNPATQQVESINFAETESARGEPIWRTGHLQSYNLSLSGGAETVRYYLAGDWDNEQGAERDNVGRRVSGRASLTVNPYRTLEVVGTLGYVKGHTDLSCEAGCGGTTWAAYFSTPAHAQADANGTPDRRRGARSLTPEAYYGIWDRFQDLSRTTGSVQGTYTPMEWLTARVTFGFDEAREDNQTIAEYTALYREWNTGTGGKDVARRDASNTTLDVNGTANFPLMDGRLTTATTVGAQLYRRQTRFASASGTGFPLPGLRVINATATTSGGETFVQNSTVGIFAQQQFGWQDRMFLTLGLRADDNSAFGEEFSLVYYPKASATWVLSEEPFWRVPMVNTLRLRSAYGFTGQQPGAFDALRTYIAVAGPGDVSTVTPGSVGNAALGPERASELELGFDAGFLQDRVGLEFTFYNSRTDDAILLQSVAPSTGFSGSRFINVGSLQNRGFEVMLRGQPVATRNFGLETTLSYSRNQSKVLDLGGLESIVADAAFGVQHRVGMPVGAWYHRRVVSAEFDAANRIIRSSMLCDDGEGGTTACYSGSTPVAPFVYQGHTIPPNEGAFSSTLTLRGNLRLYGLIDFKTGFKKWDHVTRVRCSLFNTCLESVSPGEFVGDPTSQTNRRLAAYQTADQMGAEYIRDASFARLREVSASYTLPVTFARRLGAASASVNVAARNLYTWSDWTGMEPEAMFLSGTRGGFTQLEQNHLPQLTQFVTSINLGF